MGRGERMYTEDVETAAVLEETSKELYKYINDAFDPSSNVSVKRVQRLWNTYASVKYGDNVAPLAVDGMYGRKSIRAVNGFKQLYESSTDNMIDEMIKIHGPDFMYNPENSPKLPRYKNPMLYNKKKREEAKREYEYRKSAEEGPDEPFPPGGL